jgi:AbrB family looped-hinge helix DNA binding protein
VQLFAQRVRSNVECKESLEERPMEARARMTSKGQITVPVEVRRALGVEAGDTLVFEVADAYATLRKRRPTLEVAREVRARHMSGPLPKAITNREAIEVHFATRRQGGASEAKLYVSAGDGTFAERATQRGGTADGEQPGGEASGGSVSGSDADR